MEPVSTGASITGGSALLLWAIIASGINAGAFFAFSNFVMSSLGRLPPDEGARAMQEINRTAPNVGFMATLMGGAIAGLVLVATASGQPGAGWQVTGGAFAALTALITIVFHVPRNEALARLDADDSATAALWRRYVRDWTRGNHVRTATATAAVVCLVMAAAA